MSETENLITHNIASSMSTRLLSISHSPSSLTEDTNMAVDGCWAFSGFVAHLKNTELRESTAFIMSSELLELGRIIFPFFP